MLSSSLNKALSLCALVACFIGTSIQGSSAEIKSSDSIQNEIDAINVQLEYLKIKVSDNKKKTRNLEASIKSKKQEIQNLGSQIGQLAKNQADTLAQIQKLEDENADSKKQLKELLIRFRSRLVQLHKIRQGTLVSSVIFAKDLNSFLNRYEMVKYLLESDKTIIEELREKEGKVKATSQKLKEKNLALEAGKKEIAEKQKKLTKDQASLNAMLNTVLVEKKLFLKKEKDLAASRKELEKQIEKAANLASAPAFEEELANAVAVQPALPAQAIQPTQAVQKAQPLAAPTASPKTQAYVPYSSANEQVAPQKPIEKEAPEASSLPIDFTWPITKDLREQVYEKGEENSCALLIKPLADAEIAAVAKGKVLYKGFLSGLGDVVILGHQRGFSTVYARLDTVWVGLNEVVEQGTVIGKIEAGGNNGVLHFEIRFGGKKMPPLQYLPQ